MAYQLRPYLVEETKIRSLYGSQDKRLADLILQNQGLEIAALAEYFREIRPREALEDILQGQLRDKEAHADCYAWAYEWLCRYYGQSLDNSEWQALGVVEMASLNLEPNFFMPLASPEDFPVIASIAHHELGGLISEWRELYLDEEALEQAEAWFERAKKNRKDLVFACYFV